MRANLSLTGSDRGAGHQGARGFTLVELLVTIGIIAVLVGILLPVISKVRTQMKQIAKATALHTIADAIANYKQDFGNVPTWNTSGATDSQMIEGSALLGRCLLGPGPASPSPAINPTNWQGADGHDGPGFCLRSGGQVYGPYLRPEKFAVQFFDYPPWTDANNIQHAEMYGYRILDMDSMPYLYAPAQIDHPALENTITFVGSMLTPPNNIPYLIGGGANYALYRLPAYDVNYYALPGEPGYQSTTVGASAGVYAIERLQMMLGDFSTDANTSKGMTYSPYTFSPNANFSGIIAPGSGKNPITTVDFLLWVSGPTGKFGFLSGTPNQEPLLKDMTACQDVTNFNIGLK